MSNEIINIGKEALKVFEKCNLNLSIEISGVNATVSILGVSGLICGTVIAVKKINQKEKQKEKHGENKSNLIELKGARQEKIVQVSE